MHLEFHWLANRMITAWVFSCFGDSLLTLLLICHCIGWVQTESAVRRVARVLSHQKDHYSRSRSFGVTLADECEDAPFTACLIKTLPTQDPGTHYSAFWSFGITMVGKTQISPSVSSVNPGITEGIPRFIILGEDLEERCAAAPPTPPPGLLLSGDSPPPRRRSKRVRSKTTHTCRSLRGEGGGFD